MNKKLIMRLCVFALLCQNIPAQTQPAPPANNNQTQTQPKAVVIPEGTVIQLKIHEPVSSKLNDVGDEVIATIKKDVEVDGTVLLRAGTEVIGRVTVAKAAKRPLKGGMLHISFDRVRFDDGMQKKLTAIVQSASDFGRDEKIKSTTEGTLKGGKAGGDAMRNIGTGAGIGSAAATIIVLAGRSGSSSPFGIGGIGGGSAAAAAGVLGAGVIAGILFTKGKEVRLDAGSLVRLRLERPLSIE